MQAPKEYERGIAQADLQMIVEVNDSSTEKVKNQDSGSSSTTHNNGTYLILIGFYIIPLN